jgi:hypothetical protein
VVPALRQAEAEAVMKIALITTTINIPTVLKLYRACDCFVGIFVAPDKKTPEDALNFCRYDVADCHIVYEDVASTYACSSLLGWNTIARRNIALLEALKWGADLIVTVDDDNIPMSLDYFYNFEKLFTPIDEFLGGVQIQADSPGGWFDPGSLLQPPAPHRGFPRQLIASHRRWRAVPAVDQKVGVAAGICLGDPDIDAVERIANAPTVHGVSELLRAGIAVDPAGPKRITEVTIPSQGTSTVTLGNAGTWTVFNSQNTAFVRELAPCFLMVPSFGRYDDIFASLICQRVMRELNYVVHFGQPFVWQQRNPHDLFRDLNAELFGMEHILDLADSLDGLLWVNSCPTVVDMLRHIWAGVTCYVEPPVRALTEAWLEDVSKVL